MPRAQLVELYARGLGVIEEARIDFGPGFNVITGETGAGKTLLLGALELCLGADATTSRYALSAETRAVAVFTRRDASDVVFTREASASGRLRAALDAAPSSAQGLRLAASELIVIHGQHDSLTLRSRAEVLRIIDTAGAVSTDELDALRQERQRLHGERDALGGDQTSRDREREFLSFQFEELTRARLVGEDELDNVLVELTRLTSMRDAQAALNEVVEDLDGDAEDAVLTRLARAVSRLPRDAGVEDVRDDLSRLVEGARAEVHELRLRSLPDYVDPRSIDELEARASMLQQLSRKYGGSLAAAIAQRDELAERIDRLRHAHDALINLDARLLEVAELETRAAHEVRREREVAAAALTRRVGAQLPRVALAHATLRFDVQGDDGSQAQILFAPNPGWPEGPLQSLASGGELSRVLLALSLETVHDDVVAVFDEVDAGIGGQVAQQIGDCLREVGQVQQVIAITHLASVAAKAAHHFVITKSVAAGLTTTQVSEVTGEERIREIARMLAGDAISDEADALARRLLESAS